MVMTPSIPNSMLVALLTPQTAGTAPEVSVAGEFALLLSQWQGVSLASKETNSVPSLETEPEPSTAPEKRTKDQPSEAEMFLCMALAVNVNQTYQSVPSPTSPLAFALPEEGVAPIQNLPQGVTNTKEAEEAINKPQTTRFNVEKATALDVIALLKEAPMPLPAANLPTPMPLASTPELLEAVAVVPSSPLEGASAKSSHAESQADSETEPETSAPTPLKKERHSEPLSFLEHRFLLEKPAEITPPLVEAPPPVDRSQVVEQVSKHLETMRLKQGQNEMTFHLRPDHLGEVQVHISSSSEGVVARILTENHPVQQALEGAREQLRHSLEQRGLHLVRFDVELLQSQASFSERNYYPPNPQNTPQPRAQGQRGGRIGRVGASQETVPALTTALSRWSENLSRLDYSA
jgi:hypothetical protein